MVPQIIDAAFALIEAAEGDLEFARHLWNDAFEEAERIDHNQSLSEQTNGSARSWT